MREIVDMARAERETLRWIILAALWHARPYGTSEYVLLRAAQDIPINATPDMVRRKLHYLEGLGLVKVETGAPLWHAQLTPTGEDVVDYRAPAPVGVARPPKW